MLTYDEVCKNFNEIISFLEKDNYQNVFTTTEKHLKKTRIRGITHYSDIMTKQIAAQCPNCGYRIEYEN